MFKGIWMKQSSPYKDPCSGIKIHSKEAIDNAEKIARDQITNIFVCSAKVYDFYLIAEGGGVWKFLLKGRRKQTCALGWRQNTKKSSNSRVKGGL